MIDATTREKGVCNESLLKNIRWFPPANGGSRNLIEGAKLKRLGVKTGVPYVIPPIAKQSSHGLVIELKRIDGKITDLSSEQMENYLS